MTYRASIPGHHCIHCSAAMTEDLLCPGCGIYDPPTRPPPKIQPGDGVRHPILGLGIVRVFNADDPSLVLVMFLTGTYDYRYQEVPKDSLTPQSLDA